jgi:hypothetical protein
MRVLVESTCLTWIEVDTDSGTVTAVRVHALPENVQIPADPAVLASAPDEQPSVTHEMKTLARSIASTSPLPERFRFMQ